MTTTERCAAAGTAAITAAMARDPSVTMDALSTIGTRASLAEFLRLLDIDDILPAPDETSIRAVERGTIINLIHAEFARWSTQMPMPEIEANIVAQIAARTS
jgi:hypothetical protein